MNLISFFSSFSNAIGIETFFLLVAIGVFLILLPKLGNAVVFSFILLNLAAFFFSRKSLVFFFSFFALEILIFCLGIYCFSKEKNEKYTDKKLLWFFLALALLAFAM